MNAEVRSALVAGAGPAGLAAACLLAQGGFDVTLVAPMAAEDPRTVALMDPSIRMLQHLGLWTEALRESCAPLRQLHMLDDTGNMVSAPDLRFSAHEVGLEAFGWNIPLAVLVPALRARAAELGVVFVVDEVAGADVDGNTITVTTRQGEKLTANFAVAADGRNSTLRKAAGILSTEWSFDQSALVTRFEHSGDHQGTSVEWHKKGGPFTTVPLPGNHSALVWMDKPAKIDALMHKSTTELARDIQLQNHGTLGLISHVARPHSFVMRGVKAASFAARRTFLVGEAAHVFPPVGAQGLNMSLRDVGHIGDIVQDAEDPGSDACMTSYDAHRRTDVLPRQTAISMMNRSLLSDLLPPHLARAAGLAAVAFVPPLRALALREGLAPTGGLPSAMR